MMKIPKGSIKGLFLSMAASVVTAVLIWIIAMVSFGETDYLLISFLFSGIIHGVSFLVFGAPFFFYFWRKESVLWTYTYAAILGSLLGVIAWLLMMNLLNDNSGPLVWDAYRAIFGYGVAYGSGSALIACWVRNKMMKINDKTR